MSVSLAYIVQPQRPDELKRIEAAGGQVFFCGGLRVGGILAMTRAIGEIFTP